MSISLHRTLLLSKVCDISIRKTHSLSHNQHFIDVVSHII